MACDRLVCEANHKNKTITVYVKDDMDETEAIELFKTALYTIKGKLRSVVPIERWARMRCVDGK